MTIPRFDVVGLGLNSVDLLCLVDEYPEFNTKGELLEVSRQGGGQAATAMAALSRLGMKTAYIGAVGDDEEGRFSVMSLRNAGVNVEGVVMQPGRASQFAVIIVQRGGNVEEQGGRTIMWRREVMLSPSEISEDIVKSCRILHVDGHSIEAEIKAARWAKETGISVSFDAERVLPGTDKLISMTDFLVASEDFPKFFTGYNEPEAALRKIQGAGPRIAAMTLGSKGVLAFDGKQFYDSPGFRVETIDTTGAGDVFHAGFLYGILQEFDLPRTLQFANAVAAMSCRNIGGRTGLCGRQEVEKFINERIFP